MSIHSDQKTTIGQSTEPKTKTVLVLGTGGTIAGLKTGASAYKAGQIAVANLLPSHIQSGLQADGIVLQYEQIAQIDSKNMSFVIWERLYGRLQLAMQDAQIEGVVITHGTDTLEETAFFLHLSLLATKPVVLTGAMRPADAVDSDGVANLVFAVQTAAHAQPRAVRTEPVEVRMVVVAFAGEILRASHAHKAHPTRLGAFEEHTTDAQTDAWLEAQRAKHPLQTNHQWRKATIVHNYVGADGSEVEALRAAGFTGFVVATTGNGTVSDGLQAALDKAQRAGCMVALTTRCLQGRVGSSSDHKFEVLPLVPVQARVWALVNHSSKVRG